MDERPPYWTDPTRDSFKVFIDDVKKDEDAYYITLRENVVRPAGGGQAGDRGLLRIENKVVTIQDTIMDSDRITLIADDSLPKQSKAVLEINMDWRMAMMQNHTSEHLFVSIIKKTYPDLKVGNLWIDGDHGTLELCNVHASFDDIFEAEEGVQVLVDMSIPVKTDFVDAEKIDSSVRAREDLTSKHDMLRIVNVGDLDSSACSGIHVESTEYIGYFKVVDVKYSNGNTRVEFVSGEKAITLTRNLYNQVLLRKHTYPFEMEQVGAILDGAKAAIDDTSKLIDRIGKLISSGVSVEMIGGIAFRHEYLPGFGSKDLRNLANRLSFEERSVILLFSPGPKAHVVFRTNNTTHDAAYYISAAVKKYGGKGGGSKDNFTGGFVDVAEYEELYEKLVSAVRESLSQ
ncbi:MAG: DHHA1 domain-containing protein [Candidatus Thorarchaeota archaeon]